MVFVYTSGPFESVVFQTTIVVNELVQCYVRLRIFETNDFHAFPRLCSTFKKWATGQIPQYWSKFWYYLSTKSLIKIPLDDSGKCEKFNTFFLRSRRLFNASAFIKKKPLKIMKIEMMIGPPNHSRLVQGAEWQPKHPYSALPGLDIRYSVNTSKEKCIAFLTQSRRGGALRTV